METDNKKVYIAIDLGATSGRVIAGVMHDGKLDLQEVHRFPNSIMQISGKYYWDIFLLLRDIKEGLRKASEFGNIVSVGVDTWGVDFVFLAKDGSLIGLPRAYRDPYTDKAMPEYFEVVPKEKVYGQTGIQFLPFNTVFQLFALKKENSSAMHDADCLLFIPDAITYLLSGKKVCEYTILSTGQLLDPRKKQLATELLEPSGVSPDLFPEMVMPGTVVGTLSPWLAEETGLPQIPVVAVAGHDTASAVAAVPATDEKFAYLSSGTWSLMGIEVKDPIINEDSYKANFTNEGGVFGTTRFLKNITGMWILEQCRKEWEKAGIDYSYPQLVEMAISAKPFVSMIDPDAPCFANPKSMLAAIGEFCTDNAMDAPETDADVVRCVFQSLALKYRYVLEKLRKSAPFAIEKLHVIGGGSKNTLLNQFAANATGLPVVAGPSEATAYGNVLMQMVADKSVSSLPEMRSIVAKSEKLESYHPQYPVEWDVAYQRFLDIVEK